MRSEYRMDPYWDQDDEHRAREQIRVLRLILRHLVVFNAMLALLIGWYVLGPILTGLAAGLGVGR